MNTYECIQTTNTSYRTQCRYEPTYIFSGVKQPNILLNQKNTTDFVNKEIGGFMFGGETLFGNVSFFESNETDHSETNPALTYETNINYVHNITADDWLYG